MNVPNLIASSIRHAVVECFATMMNTDISSEDVTVERTSSVTSGGPEGQDAVVSLIGLAGAWVGVGSVVCSPTIACKVCSQMLMTEATSVDGEVLDAVAELTNIIIGNVKNDLERYLGTLGLSIPNVIFGRNFQTKSGGNAEWVVVRFRWDEDELVIKLCLAPNQKQIPKRPLAPAGQNKEMLAGNP